MSIVVASNNSHLAVHFFFEISDIVKSHCNTTDVKVENRKEARRTQSPWRVEVGLQGQAHTNRSTTGQIHVWTPGSLQRRRPEQRTVVMWHLSQRHS